MNKLLISALLFSGAVQNADAAKILYFGDSHSVGPFGVRMDYLLRKLPAAEVVTYSRCGSIIEWWYSGHSTTCGFRDVDAKGKITPQLPRPTTANPKPPLPVIAVTPKIVPIIDEYKPDLLVVEMGGNYQHANHPIEDAKRDIGVFIAEIQRLKINCVWMGPPSRRDNTGLSELEAAIRATVEPTCTFIDSSTLTVFPTHAANGGPLHGGKDGIHYSFLEGIPVAQKWAETAFETVKIHYSKISP
jgi:hypothetical protein